MITTDHSGMEELKRKYSRRLRFWKRAELWWNGFLAGFTSALLMVGLSMLAAKFIFHLI